MFDIAGHNCEKLTIYIFLSQKKNQNGLKSKSNVL